MFKETSSKFFLTHSITPNPTSSFIKPELPEMNVQMLLQNTKPAMETASHLKQTSTPQALVAIPSLILAGLLLKKLISKNLVLKLPNTALD